MLAVARTVVDSWAMKAHLSWSARGVEPSLLVHELWDTLKIPPDDLILHAAKSLLWKISLLASAGYDLWLHISASAAPGANVRRCTTLLTDNFMMLVLSQEKESKLSSRTQKPFLFLANIHTNAVTTDKAVSCLFSCASSPVSVTLQRPCLAVILR